jgi:hypothetical protein
MLHGLKGRNGFVACCSELALTGAPEREVGGVHEAERNEAQFIVIGYYSLFPRLRLPNPPAPPSTQRPPSPPPPAPASRQ